MRIVDVGRINGALNQTALIFGEAAYLNRGFFINVRELEWSKRFANALIDSDATFEFADLELALGVLITEVQAEGCRNGDQQPGHHLTQHAILDSLVGFGRNLF